MDGVLRFRVSDDDSVCAEQARRIEALLVVIDPRVLMGSGRASKNLLGVGEIKAVLVSVDSLLGSGPCEFHGFCYAYTGVGSGKVWLRARDAGACGSVIPALFV